MPNYKGVEVPHLILTEDDVVLHHAQNSPDAVIYADPSEPPTAPEEGLQVGDESSDGDVPLEEVASDDSSEPDVTSTDDSSNAPETGAEHKKSRRRRGS